MKLVFLLKRANNYRFFFSLISEALAGGIEVECWHNQEPNYLHPQKTYQIPEDHNLPKFNSQNQPTLKIFRSQDQLIQLLLGDDSIDFFISIDRPEAIIEEKVFNQLPFEWGVMMTADSFVSLKKIPRYSSKYSKPVYFFVYSDEWSRWGKRFLEKFYPGRVDFLDENHVVIKSVGHPEFDSFSEMSPDRIRKKYGIPQGKQIFLYLPCVFYDTNTGSAWSRVFCGILINKNRNKNLSEQKNKNRVSLYGLLCKVYDLFKIFKDPYARRCWWKNINEGKVIEVVKEFCRRNNLLLVVKPRLKFPVASPVQKGADLIVWDSEENFESPALKELLTISKICISYCSFSVITSVFASVFHLGIKWPKEYFRSEDERFWFPETDPSLYNFRGVCDLWSVEQMLENFLQVHPDTFKFNPTHRDSYVKSYIGFDDFSSGKRILEEIRKVIAEKENVKS